MPRIFRFLGHPSGATWAATDVRVYRRWLQDHPAFAREVSAVCARRGTTFNGDGYRSISRRIDWATTNRHDSPGHRERCCVDPRDLQLRSREPHQHVRHRSTHARCPARLARRAFRSVCCGGGHDSEPRWRPRSRRVRVALALQRARCVSHDRRETRSTSRASTAASESAER